MSSFAGASDPDRNAALDCLSGPQLVKHLRATCRRADYDAAEWVLGVRDRRLAEAKAALAEAVAALAELQPGLADANARLHALREEYNALEAARRGPIARPSRVAIAAPAPRGDGRAEGADKKDAEVVDLSDSSDDGEEDWEEGEFRPVVAGLCRKTKEPAHEGAEGRRAGVPCKRNARMFVSSSDDDDRIPLSQYMKKRRGAEPVPNGEPNKEYGDVQANPVAPLGDHPPERPPVNKGDLKASAGQRAGASRQLKVAASVQGRGRICQSGKGGGLSRAMPTRLPTDSATGNRPRINSSKADGAEDGARIGDKQGSAAGKPFQVRIPSHMDTARRIVESARAGAEMRKKHTDSAPDPTIGLVLNTNREQGKTNGGMHKMKAPLETSGTGDSTGMVLRAVREQQKTQGQVLMTKVVLGTNGIGQQCAKLSTCQNGEVSDGGRLRTSDKPVSASMQLNNQLTLHSEQMPVKSSLPTSLQPNNQLILHSQQIPVESSLPSAVTRHWESASDVSTECILNKEICMQAACALHRQRKLTIQEGRSGCTELSKFDVHRVVVLVEFLLDGNLHGPLKRTAEELVKHDSGGLDLLERVAMNFSEQLFSIYRNKEDAYFR